MLTSRIPCVYPDESRPDFDAYRLFAIGIAKWKKRELASDNLVISEQLIRLSMDSMKGLNKDLLQFIECVAPDGNLAVCEVALSMMDDPLYVGLGRCSMASEMIELGKREEARRLLATDISELDAANVSLAEQGRFFVAAISPYTRLDGKSVPKDMCKTLEKLFPPELAAEAYRLFAFSCFPEEKSDAEESLERSEQILMKVSDPLERAFLFRRVYQTRSSLFGEESGLNAAEKVSDRIEKCFAFLGVAEGLNLPKVREK